MSKPFTTVNYIRVVDVEAYILAVSPVTGMSVGIKHDKLLDITGNS